MASVANLYLQSKFSSRFLFGEYKSKANIAASLAVILIFSNSVSAKSKIAKKSQVKSTKEGCDTVNPARDNLLKYSLCKRLVSLSPFIYSGYILLLDFLNNVLAIHSAIEEKIQLHHYLNCVP